MGLKAGCMWECPREHPDTWRFQLGGLRVDGQPSDVYSRLPECSGKLRINLLSLRSQKVLFPSYTSELVLTKLVLAYM